MSTRSLQKWHGAGNDFLVDVTPDGQWWTSDLARAACDRWTGVGADGVLVAVPGEPVTMRLFNADGSEAEMSGNGIRCLAAAVRRATSGTWTTLDVATAAGTRRVTLHLAGAKGEGSVAMGDVTIGPTPEGALGSATVGNPHVVVLDDPSWSDAERERRAAAFAATPGGANVEFVRVEGEDRVVIRVIERGVGWTRACGTGSCAVAAVTRAAGLTGSDVVVENPGGPLRVTLDGDAATLSGPVAFVADVEWRVP